MAKRIAEQSLVLQAEAIEKRILFIRGHRVMLDSDLAELYQVPTKSLNLAVRRNATRFPEDFMFRLTKEEADLRFQFETSKTRGGRRYLPYAFTEQGVAMLSSVLHSARAVQVNIAIMRTFVRLRQILATHKDIAEKLQAMERKYDKRFKVVFEILHRLMAPPPEGPRRPIGFVSENSTLSPLMPGCTPRVAAPPRPYRRLNFFIL